MSTPRHGAHPAVLTVDHMQGKKEEKKGDGGRGKRDRDRDTVRGRSGELHAQQLQKGGNEAAGRVAERASNADVRANDPQPTCSNPPAQTPIVRSADMKIRIVEPLMSATFCDSGLYSINVM